MFGSKKVAICRGSPPPRHPAQKVEMFVLSWPFRKLLQNNSLEYIYCNYLCNYYENSFHQSMFFAMLLPLVCPCLQENMRQILFCRVIVLQLCKIVPKQCFCEAFFVIILAGVYVFLKLSSYIFRLKVRWWAFILGSTVPDPLRTVILKDCR